MKHNFCTLFDRNYLSRGLALHNSIALVCPDYHLWILCMDNETWNILRKIALPNVTLIALSDFEDSKLKAAKTTRSHGEYCWTCTPSLILFCLKKYGLSSIAYVDSDLYFYSNPTPIYDEMGNASILLIPHRFVPWKKSKEENGIYNVSMLIFRNDKYGLASLKWWREKCLDWCYYKVEKDRMGDQKYLDQFPKLFKGVHILKHLGAGVSHWNINQYRFEIRNKEFYIEGYTLIFYHFQGFELYSNSFFLPWGPKNIYSRQSIYSQKLYRLYFLELVKQNKKVLNIASDYRPIFAHSPKLLVQVKDWLLSNWYNIKYVGLN